MAENSPPLASGSAGVSSRTQSEKAQRFRSLHEGPNVLLIPNPWDAGSAKILASLGFKALATSSGASAATLGRLDGTVTREQSLSRAQEIAAATDLPVSADLEKGFSDDPKSVAQTIYLAAAAGLVGCSIEDATGDPRKPIYDITQATERIAAAAEAARKLSFPFTLTARAENYLRGNPNLDDTIQRLIAFQNAGADVLFAPCLPDLAAVRTICAAVKKPVNFMVGVKGKSFSVAELTTAGVRRISFASSLYRAAMTGLLTAVREISEHGTFTYLETIMTNSQLIDFLKNQ
jgi:2-methylisocitrate lyase-like PEP mutase family enzyme